MKNSSSLVAQQDLNRFLSLIYKISTRQLTISSSIVYLQARKLDDLLRLQLRIPLARGLKVHDKEVVELLRGDAHAALLLGTYIHPTASGRRVRITEGVATHECIAQCCLKKSGIGSRRN